MKAGLKACLVCLLFVLLMGGQIPARAVTPAASLAKLVPSTSLAIFSDGSAEINQTILPRNASSVNLPLLATQVGNILAQDQKGSAVSYEIRGQNISLSTFGVARVTLVYDTDSLTSKLGSSWDLNFVSPFNLTLTLPFESTVLSVSSAPKSFSTVNGKPIVALAAGSWQISYGLPLSISTRTNSATTGSTYVAQSVPPPSSSSLQLSQLFAIGGVAVLSVVEIFIVRGSRQRAVDPTLRYDDKEILNFINEKGGKVSEVEIRERFSLPRTSAWRQVKRLEKLGLVKITKMGLQNQVELLRTNPEQHT